MRNMFDHEGPMLLNLEVVLLLGLKMFMSPPMLEMGALIQSHIWRWSHFRFTILQILILVYF